MQQYTDLLKEVLEEGIHRKNRTNQSDRFIPSSCMKFDLSDGFPAVTTKQLYFKQAIGEVLGFLRGYENANDFRMLGCKIWDSDANENATWLNSPYRKGTDDVGKIYGSTWRSRAVYKESVSDEIDEYLIDNGYSFLSETVAVKEIDQLKDVVEKIISKPNDRRIIMHAWFPELFDEMALPPCHVLYRFIPDEENKVLHLGMYQRSCDLLLGVPFNIFGASLLLSLVAKCTGYTPGVFTHHLDDVHLYDNAIEQAKIQSVREPLPLPTLSISKEVEEVSVPYAIKWLETVSHEDIALTYYQHHPKLEMVEMAQETVQETDV